MTAAGRKRRDVAHTPALAKIARPVLTRVYARVRLFRLLDRARKRPVVWVSAPAGSGKTTLVASYVKARRLPVVWYQMDASDNDVASFFYHMGLAARRAAARRRSLPLLTGEYLAGLPTFTANYFRDLFGRLRRSSVVVFDNYQDVPADGKLQHLLQHGFAEIPAGINVIVISRVEPPAAYARARASDRMTLLGWEEMKLTEREGAEIVRLRRRRQQALAPKRFQYLYQMTRGWVAGLVLLAEQPSADCIEPITIDAHASQAVFDYFASEIFRHGERGVQEFLLKTAFLPRISLAVTQPLTGRNDSEAILGYLTRRNLFTTRHTDGSYEYHPLFRAFLIERARSVLGADVVREIKKRSALLLADGGDVEVAVSLLQQASDWNEAVRMIDECAPTLLAQGRSQMLETWLQSFPEDFRAATPSLLYWYGMCQLPFAPAAARASFERAYALFEKETDSTALYRAWCGVIESYLLERNDFTPMPAWLDLYSTLAAGRPPPEPSAEIAALFTYISGRLNASFDHPDLAACVERASRLLNREAAGGQWLKEVVALIPYYLWKGELAKTRELLDRLSSHARSPDASPLTSLSWYVWKSWYSVSGAPEESLPVAMEGLDLARRSGVHVFDATLYGCGVWGRVCSGDLSRARQLLDKMLPSIGRGRISSSSYRHFAAIVHLQEGDLIRAAEEARLSALQARDSGTYVGSMSFFICLAFVLAAQGDTVGATQALAEGRAKAVRVNGKVHMFFAKLCEANIERRRGATEPALHALRDALALAQEMGAISPAYCPRDDAAKLYAMALDADIHADYVREIIRKTRLAPPAGHVSERWPWPVRVYTLGRFVLMKGDKPLVFGRTRHKPLELLRALISFGGRDVNVGKLTQILWPDTDSDMGRRVMETTLHRLRRLVGEECIVRHDNQLSLNPEHCWLDIREFDQLTEVADGTAVAARAQRLLDLYRGPFFGEDDAPAMLGQRERLRARFLRVVVQLGQRLESEVDCRAAVSCYEKGIDVEPLAEELYLRLMRCYRRLNRPAEALAVYRRCNKTLASVLQIEPNQETRTLYLEIQQGTS
jgi:LuxR family maltose regulon positive regulatory protein